MTETDAASGLGDASGGSGWDRPRPMNRQVFIMTTFDEKLERLIRIIAPPRSSFDSEENLRANLKWYEQQRVRKEQKRIVHNAICDVQHKSVAQQLDWVKENRDLASSVFKYLHPEVQREVIEHAEREIHKPAEEFERKQATQRRLKKDVNGFLRRMLPPGRRVPARLVIAKAVELGISERTLYRAKGRLHIRSERLGFGAGGHFVWFFEDTNT
jgi:hypothetical protein